MHHRLIAALLLALAAAAGCRDATAPTRIELRLTAVGAEPTYTAAPDGSPFIDCVISFDALATGDEGATAEWAGLTMRYFAGADRGAAVDSTVMSAQELAWAFGAPTIRAGKAQRVSWRVVSRLPFVVEGEVRYRAGGRDGAISARHACGVDPQVTAAPRPVLRLLPVSHHETEPEPGDTVRFTLNAESAVGLWEVLVEAPGAEPIRFAPRGLHLVEPVSFVVPRDATAGQPIEVSVWAMDMLGQASSISLATPPVRDRTPPSITSASLSGGGGLGGQFPPDQAVEIRVRGEDNGVVEWLVLASPDGSAWRDSLAFPPTGELRAPLPAEVRTDGGLRLELVDAGGNRSEPVVAPAGSFRFYPVRNVTTRSVRLPFGPAAVVVDAEGDRAYLLHSSTSGQILPLSLTDMAFGASIPVSRATVIDLTPEGRQLVALAPWDTTLAVVDLSDPGSVRRIALPRPFHSMYAGMATLPNGRALVSGHLSGLAPQVLEVDLASGASRVRTDVANPPGTAVVRSGSGERVLFAYACLYEAEADRFLPCATPIGQYGAVSSDLHGNRWSRGIDVFDEALRPLSPESRRDYANHGLAALSPDGRHLLVPSQAGLLRVGAGDGLVQEAYLPELTSVRGIVVTRDGRRAIVYDDNNLIVYELP